MYSIGIDLGGTNIAAGIVNDANEIVRKASTPTNANRPAEEIARDMADLCLRLIDEAALTKEDIAYIGIATPGTADSDAGVVVYSNNLPFVDFPIAKLLSEFTGIARVIIDNDANAAALGEQWQGGGRGFSSVLLVTLGTGVGAGIVQDGTLLSGCHGAAGELGHICMDPNEPDPCSCGNHGCLEQYCSATGIVNMAAKAGLGMLTAKEVFDLAAGGNAAAMAVVDRACDILGRGLATACCVLDPEVIVLGGGVSRAGELLRTKIETAFRKYAFHACEDTEIRLATLGNDAGIYGAARLAMEQ